MGVREGGLEKEAGLRLGGEAEMQVFGGREVRLHVYAG